MGWKQNVQMAQAHQANKLAAQQLTELQKPTAALPAPDLAGQLHQLNVNIYAIAASLERLVEILDRPSSGGEAPPA